MSEVKNLPFILQNDECFLKKIGFQYIGNEIITTSSSMGLYGSGLFAGMGTAKTRKKKAGGIFATAYFTNKRLVVTETQFKLFGGTKEGDIISMIGYDKIQGITPRKFIRAHNIDLVVKDHDGSIANITLNIGPKEKERDELIKIIQDNREKLIHKGETVDKKLELTDPLQILKIRLAKGEISEKEFKELSELLKKS